MVRNYKGRMGAYRLTGERYHALRSFCRVPANRAEVEAAMAEACADALSVWLLRHVTTDAWPWARLEASGVPCGRDTFRLYRARFYWCLGRQLAAGEHAKGEEA